MPPDWLDESSIREIARLRAENEAARRETRQLKAFLVYVMHALKEIEKNLQKTLDEDEQ